MLVKFKPNKFGIILIILIMAIALILIAKKRKKQTIMTHSKKYKNSPTWDKHTDRRILSLHPLVQDKAREFIIRAEKELGIKLRITKGLRTWQEQDDLYNRPFDGKDNDNDGKIDEPSEKVTNAKGGQSYHNYGLAIDVVEIKNGKALWRNPNWNKIAELGKSIGFEWGGNWKSIVDKPHFQMRFGRHHRDLAKLYRSGNRTGEYVNIT